MWQMPQSVNLDTSGLRCSSRTEVLNRRDKVYSNMATLSNAPLHLASNRGFKSALVIFASICTVGNGLKSIAHSLQGEDTKTSTTKSAFSNAMESYLSKYALQRNDQLLFNNGPIEYCIK
jgi:hypothetical protein